MPMQWIPDLAFRNNIIKDSCSNDSELSDQLRDFLLAVLTAGYDAAEILSLTNK